VSEDGSHVYFVASGALAGENREGKVPIPGQPNLYVFERDATHPAGHLAFIATLAAQDQEDWAAEDIRPVQATPDGHFLVFQSGADLTPGDTSSATQIFEYDASSEELARVSTGEAGYAAGITSADENASSIEQQRYSHESNPGASSEGLVVSDDGSLVVFTSAGGLTRDAAGGGGVYEFRTMGRLSEGRVFLLARDSPAFRVNRLMTDAAGTDVIYRTTESLLPEDGDSVLDTYDARENGGALAGPFAQDCEINRSCQGPLTAPPLLGGNSRGSAGTPGGGNLSLAQTPVGPVHARVLTRVQLLAKALKACRSRSRRLRTMCEKRARRRYGPTSKAGRTVKPRRREAS
jgi:hypothetical protein